MIYLFCQIERVVFLLKLLDWNDTYTNGKMKLKLGTYMTNPSCMAISLLMAEGGDYPDEPYGNVTVNLADDNELLPKYHAYVDVNNMPEAEDILKGAGIVKSTEDMRLSGFVAYPLYEFDKDVLAEYVSAEELKAYEDSYSQFAASHGGVESSRPARRKIEVPDDNAGEGLSRDDVDLFSLI